MKFRSVLFAALFVLPFSVMSSDFKGENLLQKLPEGYKLDFKTKQKNMLLAEMVPESESVKNWTEMLTVQVFQGLRTATPKSFQDRMQKLWSGSCKESAAHGIAEGAENGYTFSFWLQSCGENPATGKPEVTLFKAIQGNDSFYVVQKAFKFNPTKEQIMQWSRYLKGVSVCDSRLPERACQIAE